MDHPYLTSGQAARRLGIAKGTLLRAVRRGAITPADRTPGGFLRFHAADIDAYAVQVATRTQRPLTPQIVWTMPPDGLADDLPFWRAFTGQTVAEVASGGWLDALHPDDRARTARAWAQAIATMSVWDTTCRVRRGDGVYRTVRLHGVPIRADDGRVRDWVGFGTDITERTQVEQDARRSEARLALQYAVARVLTASATLDEALPALLETIGTHLDWDVGGFWQSDPDGTVLRCRALWHRPSLDVAGFATLSTQLTFAPGVGLPGRVWASAASALIADVAHDTNFPRAALAAAAGLHGAVGFPALTSRGVQGVLEFFSHEVADLSADLVQALTTLGTQIGGFIERTHTEEARQASDARKGALLETALDAIITIDYQGHIVEFNPAAEQTFGYSRDAALGCELAELVIPPDLRAQHRAGLATYLATGQGPLIGRRVEVTALRADGTVFPAEVAITRIPLADPPLFTGNIRDITERKRAETEVQHNQRRAAFLSDASALLASSLDYETTLTSVAHLVVPHLADWCGVDIVEPDGILRSVAVAHVDPAKVALAHDLQRRYPPDPSIPHGPWHVLRTGQAELIAEIPDDLLVAAAQDAEHLRIVRELGLRSSMCVPLVARERTLGAITFVAAESRHHYGPDDLALAEELARRAAMAVDNARLYREAQAAEERVRALNAELEQRVVERTAQLEAAVSDLLGQIAARQQHERTIDAQQEAIRALSTPVLQVRERLLILPIIGVLDAPRAQQLTAQLLGAIRGTRAKAVVIDLTGVPAVDTPIATHLGQTVEACRLMGARVIITGLSAEIARTLVMLGADLSRLDSRDDLRQGLEEAERLLGYEVRRTAVLSSRPEV